MASRRLIDLHRGWPNTALLPTAHLLTSATLTLQNPSISHPALLYGPDAGYPPLRHALSHWLSAFYQPTTPARLCISGGASSNLARILLSFSDPAFTSTVWMVAPVYYFAGGIFEDAGFGGRMRAVLEDGEGVDLGALREGLRSCEEEERGRGGERMKFKNLEPQRKIYRHIIFAVPTFSNPSSKTMSLTRRIGLVRIAREYDALIITDDVYDFLQWSVLESTNPTTTTTTTTIDLDRAILPRLVDIDRELDGGAEREGADGFGNVVSNGSFSKIVGPGVRTGWSEGTEKFTHGLSLTGSTRSGGAPSQLTAAILTNLLESGLLTQHIQHTLRLTYARNYRTLLTAIKTHLFPLGASLPSQTPHQKIAGGYFTWLSLPSPLSSEELARRAREEENVIVSPGALFEVKGDKTAKFKGQLRLCFSWESAQELEEGVERLAKVIRGMLEEASAG